MFAPGGPVSKVAGQRFAEEKRPLVTIVTPSFNQGRYLERTIRSVLNQDYPRIEYIVADSLSSDETADVLRKYSGRISRIIREKDRGQSHALNKGFSLASGRILAWLNSDDCYASPHVVSAAVEYLKSHSDIDLVYGRRKYVDENGYLALWFPYREFAPDQIMATDYIPQECCFWTREIFERCGACIDESFDFAMDYELWLRFLKNGARFAATNEFYGLFRWYPDQKSQSQWETKGLPEVERLLQQYCGIAKIDGHLLGELFWDHFVGFTRRDHPQAEGTRQRIWNCLEQRAKFASGTAPLDSWVFARGYLND